MIKWIRTSRLSITNSHSGQGVLSVDVDGCGLSAKDANFVVDRAGRSAVEPIWLK